MGCGCWEELSEDMKVKPLVKAKVSISGDKGIPELEMLD